MARPAIVIFKSFHVRSHLELIARPIEEVEATIRQQVQLEVSVATSTGYF